MFDIGFAELLVVGVMGLVVLGPEKLPTAARTLGLWVGRIRRSLGSIQKEISEELRVDELRRSTPISKEKLDQEFEELKAGWLNKPFDKESSTEKAAEEPAQTDDFSDQDIVEPAAEPKVSAAPGVVSSADDQASDPAQEQNSKV
jgi:sec-independent protein translocase protein TatB